MSMITARQNSKIAQIQKSEGSEMELSLEMLNTCTLQILGYSEKLEQIILSGP